ncbi:hypothetical protein HJG60_008375 [Phyllostomus discolor]|uniref:Uncharacterized protein n=1 Tax=Phyllostomus discolor TaxID=89673 RepID=A0A833Z2V9_9CHIR|nr:hypothetical protein HJG60_008375 [Phyllostomus discolor]
MPKNTGQLKVSQVFQPGNDVFLEKSHDYLLTRSKVCRGERERHSLLIPYHVLAGMILHSPALTHDCFQELILELSNSYWTWSRLRLRTGSLWELALALAHLCYVLIFSGGHHAHHRFASFSPLKCKMSKGENSN